MTANRPLRILWCSRHCLADTTSGASLSVRTILGALADLGCEIAVVGATVCDQDIGLRHVREQIDRADSSPFLMRDRRLTYNLIRTRSTVPSEMQLDELNALFRLYRGALASFAPDIVWFYGGSAFDHLIPNEARRQGIPTLAYLANGNFRSSRWCADVDLILTNSNATRDLYHERLGLSCETLGSFVEPEGCVAYRHDRTHVTFVNPILAKGGGIVAQIAMALGEVRPDIPFEVVESRGRWEETLLSTSKALGSSRTSLPNVNVTPHTDDMRPVYSRSRIVLAPSLWWESSGRVVIEAMLNGIPAIVSSSGGMSEMMGGAGFTVRFPSALHESPYNRLLPQDATKSFSDLICRLFDEQDYYDRLAQKALQIGKTRHDVQRNAQELLVRLYQLAAAHGVGPHDASM